MYVGQEYTADQKQDAYEEGISAALGANGETGKASNPYSPRSVLGRRWTAGWNKWVARSMS